MQGGAGAFYATAAGDVPPLSPEAALASFRTKPELEVELVAAEPLVVDPVAIDFGPDGRLWVVEMRDYPMGMDGKGRPGGRVKVLEDTDGDGRFDRADVFLQDLPFPTGLIVWHAGLLVCAAPDLLHAEDTDGDRRADRVRKLFTGFSAEHPQARMNSLSHGLDNWIYGAGGLRGGVIQGMTASAEQDIRGHDFRMRPDSGGFERAAGSSQYGRARDDWGNWFGCDNTHLLWHYPLPDRYARRNPNVVAPDPAVDVPRDPSAHEMYPISRPREWVNASHAENLVTSACGVCLYRDERLGSDYAGNAFVCEPAYNLVHRLTLVESGVTFSGHRPDDEQASEFLASTDTWFRPVQARTGPDGSLWVVDMYRRVIEHPRYIPKDSLALLDVRAGEDCGRIYRIRPRNGALHPAMNLGILASSELVAALESGNGTRRDLVHQELVRRMDPASVEPLINLSRDSSRAAVRLQALCVLDGLGSLTRENLVSALADAHPAVRRHALRLGEPFVVAPRGPNRPGDAPSPERRDDRALLEAMLQRASDPDATVRYQLALSLGESRDPRAFDTLGRLAVAEMGDEWFRAAAASGVSRSNDASEPAGDSPANGSSRPPGSLPTVTLLESVLTTPADAVGRGELIGLLLATLAAKTDPETLAEVLGDVAPGNAAAVEGWQIIALASLQDALDRLGMSLPAMARLAGPGSRFAIGNLGLAFQAAHTLARDPGAAEAVRTAAVRLHGRGFNRADTDLPILLNLAVTADRESLRQAAIEQFRRVDHPQVSALLLANWRNYTASERSAVAQVLFTRSEWRSDLLDALYQRIVPPAELSPADRERLLGDPLESLRRRAQAVLQERDPWDRKQVVARYDAAMTPDGNPERGARVFATHCAGCHTLRGLGRAVGPDLTLLQDASREELLAAILDPNSVIHPRFVQHVVVTGDGRSVSGLIRAESATSLTLVNAGGFEEVILRRDVAEIRASSRSIMPERLEEVIDPGGMADLLAFLKRGR